MSDFPWAITILERFDVAGVVPDIRVAGRNVRTKRSDVPDLSRLENVALGPVDRLDLAWKSTPAESQKGQPLLTSRTRIVSRVEEAHLHRCGDEPRGAGTRNERVAVYAPLAPQATLEKPQVTDDRILSIGYDRQNAVLTIRLKDASAEPVRIQLQFRQPRLRTAIAIGPFVVLDAQPQAGTMRFGPRRNSPRYHLQGEISPPCDRGPASR